MDQNVSPGFRPRRDNLYGASHDPWIVFGGSNHIWPFSDEIFAEHYNSLSENPSSVELDISYEFSGLNLSVTVDFELIAGIAATNNRMIILLTYDWGAKQPNFYNASVVRYEEQNFMFSATGQSGSFEHTFVLEPSWIIENISIVAIVQSFSNREIHQAARARIPYLPEPLNARSFNNPEQIAVVWDSPDTDLEIVGYNIRRNGILLNDEPRKETYFIDTDINKDTAYTYLINTVYIVDGETAESSRSAAVTVTAVEGFVQLGSGILLNDANSPSPVNTTNQSLRGQFIYTAEELRFAGLVENDEINQFGLFIQDTFHTFPEFHIRIRHTDLSSGTEHVEGDFAVTHVIRSFATVRNNWNMIELPEAFVWNGTDNVLFDTAFTPVSFPMESGQVRIIPTQNGYRFSRHNIQTQINAETTGIRHYRPQVRLNFNREDEIPELNSPSNLFLIGSDGELPHFVLLEWEKPLPGNAEFLGFRISKNGEFIDELVDGLHYIDTDVVVDVQYTYFVVAVYTEGTSEPSNTETITLTITSENDEVVIQSESRLIGNFPNPFNPSTSIRYQVSGITHVEINVYNVRGQLVRSLVNAEYPIGEHDVIWDGRDDNGLSVGSGVYFYRMKTNNGSEIRRMALMK